MTAEPSHTPYDVVIVGAGPSGAVAAKRLAEAGMSVICFEQGEYPDYANLRHSGYEFELTKQKHFTANPQRRNVPSDYPIDVSASDIEPLMWNGVGGSSILYAAAWHRLKPSDFRVRSLDGVADDWPLSYDELAPFYARVENDFAVGEKPKRIWLKTQIGSVGSPPVRNIVTMTSSAERVRLRKAPAAIVPPMRGSKT